MAKVKANPLGLLMMEIIGNGVSEKGLGFDGGVDAAPGFRSQVPVKDGLAGQDTFKQSASKSTSRADVELRRMHLGGGDGGDVGGSMLKGSNMFNELGGGTGGKAGEFTQNKAK